VVIGGSAAALHYGVARVLVRRFKEEMTPIGDPARIRGNFLVVVERLFPDSVDVIARELRSKR
jgi:hypothetical protein